MPKPPLRTIKVCVGCSITVAGPDLYFVKVECTQEQIDNGDHYDIARNWAQANFDVGGPYWVCDEDDPAKSVMRLADWDSAVSISGPVD